METATKTLKKTIVSEARDTIAMNREIVMNILDLDDLQHNLYLYETALKFLLNWIPSEELPEFKMIERNRIFWNWFRNEWSIYQDRWVGIYMSLSNFDLDRARASYELYMKKKFIDIDESHEVDQSFSNFLEINN